MKPSPVGDAAAVARRGSRWRGALACTAALALGCGGAGDGAPSIPAARPPPPTRAKTAGDGLLAFAPAGANAVLELDVARLRDNAAVGRVVAALAGHESDEPFQPWRDAEALVFCAYRIGAPEARVLTLVAAAKVAAPAVELARGVWALGDEQSLAAARQVVTDHAPALADDLGLAIRRTQAMPREATGAALRATAELDFDARVGLAALLDLAAVPRELSVWGDVVDDAALVIWARGDDERDAARAVAVLEHLRSVFIEDPTVRRVRLVPAFAQAKIVRKADALRATVLVGPTRLARAAKLARSLLLESNQTKDESQ